MYFNLEFSGFKSSTLNVSGYRGGSIYIDCRANTTLPILSVSWRKNGEILSFQNQTRMNTTADGILVISNVTDSDAGNYTCRLILLHLTKEKDVMVKILTQSGKFCKPYLDLHSAYMHYLSTYVHT